MKQWTICHSHRSPFSLRVPSLKLLLVDCNIFTEFRTNASLEDGVEGIHVVLNHVVNISGQDEISNCDFLSGDKPATADSKDIFDHFCVIHDDSCLESFRFLGVFFKLGEMDTSHTT